MSHNLRTLPIIIGPTATGKTRLAALVAAEIDAEILCADSRQVYRNMNLGTGKDYDDYVVNGKLIPYHLMDIVDAGEKFNLLILRCVPIAMPIFHEVKILCVWRNGNVCGKSIIKITICIAGSRRCGISCLPAKCVTLKI